MAIKARFQCTAISIDADFGSSSISGDELIEEIKCIAKFNPVCDLNRVDDDPEETPVLERVVLFEDAIEIPFLQLHVPDQEIFEVGMNYTFTIQKSRQQDSFIASCKRNRLPED